MSGRLCNDIRTQFLLVAGKLSSMRGTFSTPDAVDLRVPWENGNVLDRSAAAI